MSRSFRRQRQQKKSSERDPEVHQTKKGNDWHLGIEMQIGVDMSSA
jgi:IS5 family transposase